MVVLGMSWIIRADFFKWNYINRGLYQKAQKMWQDIVLGIKGYFWKSVLLSLFLNKDPLSVA